MRVRPPLQAYAFGDMLVLFWRLGETLSDEIEVSFNGVPLERPIIGARMVEQPAYLLAIRVPGLDNEEPGTVRIASAASGEILVERSFKRLRPMPARRVLTWSKASRVRVEKLLLQQAVTVFPDLGREARREMAATLADGTAAILPGPNHLCYVRVHWPDTTADGLIDAQLKAVPNEDSIVRGEALSALIDNESLHFVSRLPVEQPSPTGLWLFDAGPIRCFSFKSDPAVFAGCTPTSISAWIDRIVQHYGGDKKALRGYLGMVSGDSATSIAAASAPSLVGNLEGLNEGRMSGWALDPARPDRPVRLRIHVDGKSAGEVDANLPRPELSLDGIINCGFLVELDAHWLTGDLHTIHVSCAESGAELPGSPIRLGRGEFDSAFGVDDEGHLAGWIRERCPSPGPATIQVLIDDELFVRIPVSVPASATPSGLDSPRSMGGLAARFRIPLPDLPFDTLEHSVAIEVSSERNKNCRLNQSLRIRANYRGQVEFAAPDRLTGWVLNTVAPNRPVTLDLYVNDILAARCRADQPSGVDEGSPERPNGFNVRIPPQPAGCGSLRLDFRLAGTRERVLGPPIIHVDYQAAVQALVSLARCLTQGPDPNPSHIPPIDEGTSIWLKERILSPLIREFRGRRSIVHPVTIPLAPHIRLHPRAEREALVDVVIPVYQARDDTLACIDSVLRSAGSKAMALIVINDGSPDPEFNETLRDLAKAHDFLLLENQSNLGFVATANRGMHLHPGRDVVLLNSDTVVSSGWLDRLYRAAYSDSNIGTVTPFSNNATICSFPLFCRENTVPAGISREELDRVFAEVNAGQTVDLPTAVGFCMYIRRDVLDEVGYFDEASWAQGYGEENDFCLRAAAAGWRNVAGCDVFVEHAGGRSFGDKRLDFVRRNLVKLNALYPDYPATVQVFIDHDPLAGPRNRVLKALLQRHSEKYLLTVIHSLGGGTQVAADAWMARHQADGDSSLELKCVTPNQWKLRCHGTPYELQYRFPGDFDALLQDLRELDVSRVEFHHVMQFPRVVWELPGRLSVPYDYILHDYLPICPRINMIDESGVYCGNAQYAADTCTRCIKVNGVHPDVQGMYTELGGDVASWRDTFGGFLQKARRVFAPSADASRRLRPHFKALQVEVTPHPESDDITGFAPRDGKDGVVAILGAIGLHKGYDILLSCVRNAVKDALPLRFAIIGYTCDDAALLKYENVTISGAYVREDLSRLIEQSGAGIALFLSPWPETYSFTLSEAWRGGLYPVAFDLGAIAERIRQAQVGRLIPLTTDPRVINGTLLEVFRETSPTQRLGHGESISEVPSKVQTD